jgi:uncharacterized protein (DUF2235 family)
MYTKSPLLRVAARVPSAGCINPDFSRGAFEARSLGGLITLFGVAKLAGAFSLDKAWSLYHAREKERDQEELPELRSAAHFPERIKCVGVWDTVGNIGNPFSSGGLIGRRFEFHNTRFSETIDVSLHALSVDELRGPFRPTLWTLPKGLDLPTNQHVEQVWFADRLSQNTEKSAILTLHKVREASGNAAEPEGTSGHSGAVERALNLAGVDPYDLLRSAGVRELDCIWAAPGRVGGPQG